MELPLLEILDELNYSNIHDKPEKILGGLTKQVLEKRFGKATVKSILEDSSFYLEKSEQEILSDFDLFSKAIHKIFGNAGTKVILKTLHDDLEKSGILIKDLSHEEILNGIAKKDVLDYVRNDLSPHNMAVFFKTPQFISSFLENFFNPKINIKTPSICISKSKSNFSTTKTIQLEELIQKNILQTIKIKENILKVTSQNNSDSPSRISCEGSSWLIENDFLNEYMNFKKYWKDSVKNTINVFPYDLIKLDKVKIKTMLEFYDYVITETPSHVYKKGV